MLKTVNVHVNRVTGVLSSFLLSKSFVIWKLIQILSSFPVFFLLKYAACCFGLSYNLTRLIDFLLVTVDLVHPSEPPQLHNKQRSYTLFFLIVYINNFIHTSFDARN